MPVLGRVARPSPLSSGSPAPTQPLSLGPPPRPSPCPQDHPTPPSPCPQDPPTRCPQDSQWLPAGLARLSDLRPHPWVPWSSGQRGAPAMAAVVLHRRACRHHGVCPQEGLLAPSDLLTCGVCRWSCSWLVPADTRALRGGALGEEALREPTSVCRALFPRSPWQRAWPVTPHQAWPQPREESRQGPGGSSVTSGAPRAARRLSSRRVYRFLFRGSRVVTSPVCSLSGLFLGCVSLLCPGPGVYLERGESDCSLSRAHLDLIRSISLEAYFLCWSPDGADTALRAPVC